MASPSSSSVAETILPTPDQPFSSRRGSINSPVMVDPSDPDSLSPISPELAPKDVPFTSIPPPSAQRPYTPSKDEWPRQLPSSGSMSRPARSATNPTPRAPPPPPILLRRPTDLDSVNVEDIPLRTGSSASSGPPSPGRRHGGLAAARGLNIAGLPLAVDGSVESGEEEDSLPALPDLAVPSPRRAFFAGADINGAPKSPIWQSFEVSPVAGSPGSPSKNTRRGSADLPFSPLGPNGTSGLPNGEKKFDPTPQHGIHARNMSLFFPSPGQNQQGRLSVPPTPNFASPEEVSLSVMQAGSSSKKPFNGAGDWSFGRAAENGSATPETKSKRRGHHHKHSLSHNFFSFLDPTHTNPALAQSPSPAPSPKVVDTPQPVPMPMLSTPSLLPGSPTIIPLPPSKNNPRRQLLISFSLMECLIGAGLWIEGQMSGWRCLAGVGYLVVFDAIGVAVGMFEQGNEGWRSVRRPYGVTRLTALLHFTQSLFLVFSAVYIAKESIESVVLGAGAHDHGSGGSHGHGQMMLEGDDERPFPHFLLLTATLTTVFAGSYLRNHRKLVEAVGPLFLPYRYMNSSLVKQGLSFLGNPFSVTTAGMCAGVLLSSIIVPPSALHTLDSSLSLLMTVLTIALSYPPTIAFGHVLLQTAPPVASTQMMALRKALKEIEDDRRVLGMGTMRCWTIGAGHAPPQIESKWSFSTPTHSRNNSLAEPNTPESPTGGTFGQSPMLANESPESPTRKGASFPLRQDSAGLGLGSIGGLSNFRHDEPHTPVIVSLTVHVHPDVSDRDVLEVTKLAWSKVDGAVGRKGRGTRTGMGEVTVGIKRGWEGQEPPMD